MAEIISAEFEQAQELRAIGHSVVELLRASAHLAATAGAVLAENVIRAGQEGMAVHGDNAAQSLVLSNISGNPTLRQISTTTPQTDPAQCRRRRTGTNAAEKRVTRHAIASIQGRPTTKGAGR